MLGKGVKRLSKSAAGPGTAKLKIKPSKKTMAKLKKNGSVKITVKIAYTPTGGTQSVTSKKVKLVLKSG